MAIKLLHIDCMEFMGGQRMPDKDFDLAIVDPPYGIEWHKTGFANQEHLYEKNKEKMDKWDIKPTLEYWQELKRVSKNQIVCGINYFAEHFGNFTPIVWDKKNGDSMMADGELLGTSIAGRLRIYRHAYIGRYNPEPNGRIHPTQKPVALYRWLLHNYAKEGDKILDTHGGSMSSAIACHQMGFDMVLTEIDKDYYDAGVKRYNNAIMQQSLFK